MKLHSHGNKLPSCPMAKAEPMLHLQYNSIFCWLFLQTGLFNRATLKTTKINGPFFLKNFKWNNLLFRTFYGQHIWSKRLSNSESSNKMICRKSVANVILVAHKKSIYINLRKVGWQTNPMESKHKERRRNLSDLSRENSRHVCIF